MDIDLAQIEVVAAEATGSLLKTSVSSCYWLSRFPVDSCGISAYVIGHILALSGLGEWTFVTYEAQVGIGRHEWLELRANDCPYYVDVSLHQFAALVNSAPVGVGFSPARALFPKRVAGYGMTSLPEHCSYMPWGPTALNEVRGAMRL